MQFQGLADGIDQNRTWELQECGTLFTKEGLESECALS
jgi:hypothetical protein